MTQDQIKQECETAYKQIKDAQEHLESLRAQCLHTSTFEGNYSWRIGNIQPAIICSDCGSLIKYITVEKEIWPGIKKKTLINKTK